MPLGYALLRGQRVPIRAKLIALGAGAAVIAVIELLQIPIETIVAALLPFVGIPPVTSCWMEGNPSSVPFSLPACSCPALRPPILSGRYAPKLTAVVPRRFFPVFPLRRNQICAGRVIAWLTIGWLDAMGVPLPSAPSG